MISLLLKSARSTGITCRRERRESYRQHLTEIEINDNETRMQFLTRISLRAQNKRQRFTPRVRVYVAQLSAIVTHYRVVSPREFHVAYN